VLPAFFKYSTEAEIQVMKSPGFYLLLTNPTTPPPAKKYRVG
jgi:hypothetical protein